MALAEQKCCGAKDTGGQECPRNGARELSDRSFQRARARRDFWSAPSDGVAITDSRMICIRHIERNSFPLLPPTENPTGKARSRQKTIRFCPSIRPVVGPNLGFRPCQNRVVPYAQRPQQKAPVAQLDRATVYGTVGWRFEPVRVQDSG